MTARKILIVDDDPDTRQALSIRLRASGYEPVVAADAMSAVGIARRELPALVLLDLGLPGGDGFSVMARLKQLQPVASIPIIVLSARDAANHRARALADGAVEYFEKPADNDKLLAAIAHYAHSPSANAAQSGPKQRILIVEDDRDTQRGLIVRLQASGYDTMVASDGVSALSAAQKQKPDLVLLDLGLPGGDGFTVMERLRTLTALSTIPIVVVSAREPASNRERALKAGAVAYLQKPADNDELLGVIRHALLGTA